MIYVAAKQCDVRCMSIVEVIYKSIGVAVAYLDKPSPFL